MLRLRQIHRKNDHDTKVRAEERKTDAHDAAGCKDDREGSQETLYGIFPNEKAVPELADQ